MKVEGSTTGIRTQNNRSKRRRIPVIVLVLRIAIEIIQGAAIQALHNTAGKYIFATRNSIRSNPRIYIQASSIGSEGTYISSLISDIDW